MDFYAENVERISTEIINTNNLIDVYNNKLKQINPNSPEYKKLKNKIKTLKKELTFLEKIMDTI